MCINYDECIINKDNSCDFTLELSGKKYLSIDLTFESFSQVEKGSDYDYYKENRHKDNNADLGDMSGICKEKQKLH